MLRRGLRPRGRCISAHCCGAGGVRPSAALFAASEDRECAFGALLCPDFFVGVVVEYVGVVLVDYASASGAGCVDFGHVFLHVFYPCFGFVVDLFGLGCVGFLFFLEYCNRGSRGSEWCQTAFFDFTHTCHEERDDVDIVGCIATGYAECYIARHLGKAGRHLALGGKLCGEGRYVRTTAGEYDFIECLRVISGSVELCEYVCRNFSGA